MKFYMPMDRITRAECEALGVPKKPGGFWAQDRDGLFVRAVRTGTFRAPWKGEWYLSGATPQAYRAPNDLSTAFHILRLVAVRRTTTVRHKVVSP